MRSPFDTAAANEWCPGCGNFSILSTLKTVLRELSDEGMDTSNVVLVSGIGQHGKIVDYVNVNSFYSIHGRPVPVAEAIKLANPELQVIGFEGDGDAYGEGLDHLMFAAKRNADITVLVHNNRVYGLTVGQYTPTSPLGYKGRSTPAGSRELPFNPLAIMLSAGATFIARAAAQKAAQMKDLIRQAIQHRGFSFIDVLQVCVTFYNAYREYAARCYELKDHDDSDYFKALARIREWDYNTNDSPIALGVFYRVQRPTHDQRMNAGREVREPREILAHAEDIKSR
jgi:2-oxoglutarate ferredoxin oxidoreductase subunit beta